MSSSAGICVKRNLRCDHDRDRNRNDHNHLRQHRGTGNMLPFMTDIPATSSSTATTAPAVAKHVRWWMLALVFFCRVGLGFQFQTVASVAEPLAGQLAFSYTQIGTLIGLFMLPGLLLALPSGYAGRYLSDRTLVALGLSTLAAGGLLTAVAQSFGLHALGRIVAGVGFVLSQVYLTKMVADWFSRNELATAMGIAVMSWPFGIAMGQVGHAWLALHLGWQAAFLTASAYCAIGAIAILLLYKSPAATQQAPPRRTFGMPRAELVLTICVATIWGLFNAGYVLYLSFAPKVLISGGYGATEAAAVISIASWVMIFSGTSCGQLADRTGKRDLILYVCMGVAVLALLLLKQTSMALVLSLLFGLIAIAPAGVIMALTGEVMAPQNRAFGMGVFFSVYFAVVTLAPPIGGWLFDRSGDPYAPILFAAALFAATALANAGFRLVQRKIKSGSVS